MYKVINKTTETQNLGVYNAQGVIGRTQTINAGLSAQITDVEFFATKKANGFDASLWTVEYALKPTSPADTPIIDEEDVRRELAVELTDIAVLKSTLLALAAKLDGDFGVTNTDYEEFIEGLLS